LNLICVGLILAKKPTVSVTPRKIEIKIAAGEKIEGSYFVLNQKKETTKVSIKSRYWFLSDENKEIKIADWLQFVPSEFKLKPGEKKEIKFKISIPQKAKGLLMAMNSFSPESPEESMINVVISVPLYVIIRGTEIVKAKISKVIIKKSKIKEKKKAEEGLWIAAEIENKGNIHLRPQCEAVIIDKKGKEIKRIRLRCNRPVFPKRTEFYHGSWKKADLKKGKYKMRMFVDYGNPEDILEKMISFKMNRKGKIIIY
ncbi:hypothetical protein KAI68_03750, partial [bacterium]|nr:hypothetical protein [bacterium]